MRFALRTAVAAALLTILPGQGALADGDGLPVVPIATAAPLVPSPIALATPTPTIAPTPAPEPTPAPSPTRTVIAGVASTYGPGYRGLLALPSPYGPGYRVRICGPAACVVKTSNDLGPIPSLHRVADLDLGTFERVCGCSWRIGLVEVTVEFIE